MAVTGNHQNTSMRQNSLDSLSKQIGPNGEHTTKVTTHRVASNSHCKNTDLLKSLAHTNEIRECLPDD